MFLAIFTLLLEGGVILAQGIAKRYCLRKLFEEKDLSQNEFALLQKYPLYFLNMPSSSYLSCALSGIQIATFFWVPWLIVNHYWLISFAAVVNFAIAHYLAKRLHPRFFLLNTILFRPFFTKKNFYAREELESINRLLVKIANQPQPDNNNS